ncbi:MAG: NAD(P)H-dependent oxidoreductase [Crocinitomicaceae bacterium]|nr:NAD(P)H-dependent oxidoreductase [Crocinitomicaceae bacterium]|tara:strand:+ start:4848 stop:5486 length:639 start_codon:yes stop_codon:yes gene_type:complete
MSLIEDLKWRYATKKYDSTRKVEDEKVAQIIEAARLAPTSSGLQQFHLIVISNPEIKNKVKGASFNDVVIDTCSHLLVFAAWDQYTNERIDEMSSRSAISRGIPLEKSQAYYNMLKTAYVEKQTPEQNFVHTARQSYIGLAFAMAEAATLKVDSTPMEGFDNKQVDELLDLPSKGLKSVTLLALGYRDAENDWLAKLDKVRIPTEEFVTEYK